MKEWGVVVIILVAPMGTELLAPPHVLYEETRRDLNRIGLTHSQQQN
jgi:hypothetical protein